jgi:hypothetical protein
MSYNIPTYRRYKDILKGWKAGLFVNFGQFPCSRIYDADADPDPGYETQRKGLTFNLVLDPDRFSYPDPITKHT